MTTVMQMVDLRPEVVVALGILRTSGGDQQIISVGKVSVEIDWDPMTYCHPSWQLPLALLTAAIDRAAAQARWESVTFIDAVGTAHRLDTDQKRILMALAGQIWTQGFASELSDWIARFDLAGVALTVDRDRLSRGDHHGVRPLVARPRQMPAALQELEPARWLAALAVFTLRSEADADAAFGGKYRASLNPPVLGAVSTLQDTAGGDAFAHLLRLIAAYRGW